MRKITKRRINRKGEKGAKEDTKKYFSQRRQKGRGKINFIEK